jgi:hypothetical protein
LPTPGTNASSAVPPTTCRWRTGPTHRAGEDGSLTQGTSGWAALRTPAVEEPCDDEQEAEL